MKTGMIGIVGMAVVLFTSPVARAQENQPPKPDNPMKAMELRHKQLDIEQRQSELHFNEQMRNIQLEKKRLELERDRQMLKDQEQKIGDQKGGDQKACPGKDAWQGHHGKMKHFCGLMFFCMVVHILLAIWVYQDIRKRNAGSGMWIIVTLLTGLLGALVYAVVRIGDVKREA